jgi:hypothetical protein
MKKNNEIPQSTEEYMLDDNSELNSVPNIDDFNSFDNSQGIDNLNDQYGDNEVEDDNSRWELDPDDVFNRIEHILRSERISKDGTKWIKIKGINPIVNERGLFEIMRDLNLYINKNTVLANLNEDMLNRIMRNVGHPLIIRLKNCYKEYGISKHNLPYIQRTIENSIYIFLTRALGGVERKIRRDKYKLTETQSNGSPGGIAGMFQQGNKGKFNF